MFLILKDRDRSIAYPVHSFERACVRKDDMKPFLWFVLCHLNGCKTNWIFSKRYNSEEEAQIEFQEILNAVDKQETYVIDRTDDINAGARE